MTAEGQMLELASDLEDLASSFSRMVRDQLNYRGARIVRASRPLTPVDTGRLMAATRYRTDEGTDAITLVVSNNTVYAHYQHENVLNHKNKATARDHYLQIPFEDEVPRITEAITKLIKEATE